MVAAGHGLGLLVCCHRELGGAHVRHPDLNRTQPLATQPGAVRAHPCAYRRIVSLCHVAMLHVTLDPRRLGRAIGRTARGRSHRGGTRTSSCWPTSRRRRAGPDRRHRGHLDPHGRGGGRGCGRSRLDQPSHCFRASGLGLEVPTEVSDCRIGQGLDVRSIGDGWEMVLVRYFPDYSGVTGLARQGSGPAPGDAAVSGGRLAAGQRKLL